MAQTWNEIISTEAFKCNQVRASGWIQLICGSSADACDDDGSDNLDEIKNLERMSLSITDFDYNTMLCTINDYNIYIHNMSIQHLFRRTKCIMN